MRARRDFLHGALRLVCGALVLCAPLALRAASPSEYQVKAVFLFNFSQFVEWPASAFVDASRPLVIGVLGEDPFGAYLDEAVRDETVGGRTLAVRRFEHVEDVADCQILFISASMIDKLPRVLAGLRGKPILTVGETEGFARSGGMIRFVTERSRIRLRINVEPAVASGLTISSKLLRLAEIVPTET